MRGGFSVREDPFSGEARPRLGRIARDLEAVVVDAQSRDWVADRADRVGFARLGQVRHHVLIAAGRSRGLSLIADPVAVLLGVTVWFVVGGTVLWFWAINGTVLVASVVVAGFWAGLLSVAVLRRLRRRWDRRDPDGAAPIDDPYRYAAFRRRIEARAAVARGHRSYRRRDTAIDLEYALDWLSAAQSELPHR